MQFNWPINQYLQEQLYLQKIIISGKINHAYLFLGHENKVKSEIIVLFVKSILCNDHQDQIPCNKCEICRQIKKNIYSELHVINPLKEQIVIAQIKEVKKYLSKKSIDHSHRIVIINQAQTINKSAANALLKVLEEPGARQIIILNASKIGSIPKTILSRCQTVKFLSDVEDNLDNSKEFAEWKKFFEIKSISGKISFLDKKIAKYNNQQLKKIITIWIKIWREQIINSNNKEFQNKAKNILNELLTIEKKQNNINSKLIIENIIINF